MDDLADRTVRRVIGSMIFAVLHRMIIACCQDVLNAMLDETLDETEAKWQSPPTLEMRV
jgi:hypothetical protein